eukprot:6692498-Prymnesium_polylepis.1
MAKSLALRLCTSSTTKRTVAVTMLAPVGMMTFGKQTPTTCVASDHVLTRHVSCISSRPEELRSTSPVEAISSALSRQSFTLKVTDGARTRGGSSNIAVSQRRAQQRFAGASMMTRESDRRGWASIHVGAEACGTTTPQGTEVFAPRGAVDDMIAKRCSADDTYPVPEAPQSRVAL